MQTRRFFLCGVLATTLIGAAAPALYAAPDPSASTPVVKREVATFAAGCFWSMEAIFKQLKGVQTAMPGYAGGTRVNPRYEDVETGTTGHAETINITFDPTVISYPTLLRVLLTVRDPTTLNRQGNDEGTQYRSVIFYRTPEQKSEALAAIKSIGQSHIWSDPIVTQVEPFSNFYGAERYHIDYYNKHPYEPYCASVIAPEIANFREKFRPLLKPEYINRGSMSGNAFDTIQGWFHGLTSHGG